jgi:hypothetical protein
MHPTDTRLFDGAMLLKSDHGRADAYRIGSVLGITVQRKNAEQEKFEQLFHGVKVGRKQKACFGATALYPKENKTSLSQKSLALTFAPL